MIEEPLTRSDGGAAGAVQAPPRRKPARRANLGPQLQREILLDRDMTEPRTGRLTGGLVAYFSARSPEKSSPNEDAAGLIALGASVGVVAVADGMGGQAGGERASALAIENLIDSCEIGAKRKVEPRVGVLDGIEAANQAVLDLGIGAGTTLAALEIQGRSVRPYHVGDCRILIVGGRGRVKLQTISHSPVGYAVESGMLKEREAIFHARRHVISNMIGSAEMRIEVGAIVDLAARDTALLASDGVFDNLRIDEIVEIVRKGPLGAAASKLAERALARMKRGQNGSQPCKPDDLTFILYRPRGASA